MKHLRALLLTLTIVLSTFTLPALAGHAPSCTPFDTAVFDELYADYGESPVFTGVGKNGEVVQIFLNPETGTFTLLVSNDEVVCETVSGTGGEAHKPLAPGSKES